MLITGGSGQLGTALRALVPDADTPTRELLDLSDPEQVLSYLRASKPYSIVNCGAYTAVDRAEDEEQLATVINGASVGVMARYAGDQGIPFVTISTDYVFDGTASEPYVESSAVSPINAYGRSKLAGEEQALSFPGSLVIRTSWVISGTHPNFVATMLRLAPDRELRVVDDQVGCPSSVHDLAPAILEAMESGLTGLLHMTNSGATSWYELARAAVSLAGIDAEIEPIPTSEFPTPAPRPAYSVMDSERRQEAGLSELPPWRESLPFIVAGLMDHK